MDLTHEQHSRSRKQQQPQSAMLIGNHQALHLQVLQGTNAAQVIKYEINIPQDNQSG